MVANYWDASQLKRFTIVTGHYGSGKTNLSVNLALDVARAAGGSAEQPVVTLVDLDIVNPYFRSSDYVKMLTAKGVRVISPTHAGTTLESPSLSAEIYTAFDDIGPVIFDVGGDDVGATAIGRFSGEISAIDYEMLYVVNRYRNLTPDAESAAALLREIESSSHLRATGLVNNSHLQGETTTQTVLGSLAFARKAARILALPIVCTTVPAHLSNSFSNEPSSDTFIENAYPIKVYVRPPWDDEPGADEEVLR